MLIFRFVPACSRPMTRRTILAVLSPLLLVAIACGPSRIGYAPPAASAGADDTFAVEAPFDATWQAVVQEFFERNIPIQTIEKESGIVESGQLKGEVGRECDCGSYLGVPIGGYAGGYGGDAYFNYRVLVRSKEGGATDVVLRTSCRARVEGIQGELTCRLSPDREREIREAIRQRLS